MGYTTEFEGRFTFDKLPPSEVIVALRALEDLDTRKCQENRAYPGNYCQWELTTDCMGLKWDGNEKFYKYEAWLQWIIDEILKPAGIGISGTVAYSGEDVTDCGVLTIEDGEVQKIPAPLVGDTIAELKKFRDFVMQHDDGGEIMADWRRHSRS